MNESGVQCRDSCGLKQPVTNNLADEGRSPLLGLSKFDDVQFPRFVRVIFLSGAVDFLVAASG